MACAASFCPYKKTGLRCCTFGRSRKLPPRHFSNDFADDLPDELRQQCPNGKVTGIYSKYENTWYVIVQNRKVTAKGYCVTGDAPTRARAQTSSETDVSGSAGVPQSAPGQVRVAEGQNEGEHDATSEGAR